MRKLGITLLAIILALTLAFTYLIWANLPPRYPMVAYHPPKDNAWDYYERGLTSGLVACDPDPGNGKAHGPEFYIPNPPQNVKAMEIIRRGFGKPCVLPPVTLDGSSGIGKANRECIIEIGRIFIREGNSLMIKGNYLSAADTYLDAIYIGTDICSADLSRYTLGHVALSMGHYGLAQEIPDKLSADECGHVILRLSEIDRRRIALPKLIINEKLTERQSLTLLTITKPEDIREKLDPTRQGWLEIGGEKYGTLRTLRYITSSKRATAIKLDHYYDRVASECNKPYCKQNIPSLPNSFMIKAISRDSTDDNLRILSFLYTRNQVEGRLLSLRLALRAYRLRNGRYPDRFDLGLNRYLTKSDLIDPFDGKPFRYRKNRDTYLLYSIGPDGKDDGGKPMKTGRSMDEKGDMVPRVN